MIDVHAHFADEGYDVGAEWKAIRAAGVQTVILAGDSIAHSRMHKEIAESLDGAYFTVGVHPSETDGFGEAEEEELRRLAAHPKCVAVGEIGLDYHYPDTDKAGQRRAFCRQIELANECALPIQIHSRDCAADMLAVLREYRSLLTNGFLLHCYSHGREMMDGFLELGAYFSFGGTVCFKNARRNVESAVACPADRILTETDSPYLSPFRGEKNSPCNIPVIVKKLAEVRSVPESGLIAEIRANAERLFPRLKQER